MSEYMYRTLMVYCLFSTEQGVCTVHKDHYGAKENNVPHLGITINYKIWLIYPSLTLPI